MICPIVRDPMRLAQRSADASPSDLPTAKDLADTLQAHAADCVGMAANMIGKNRRIIVVRTGPVILTMFNPRIVARSEPYEAEEGCLSLSGTRSTTRYRQIRVTWQDERFKTRTSSFAGFTAQIIQHEIDHCDGILI